MDFIKFVGIDRKNVVRKALDYYFDHRCEPNVNNFLSKCRIQKDLKTIHYYYSMKINKNIKKNKFSFTNSIKDFFKKIKERFVKNGIK